MAVKPWRGRFLQSLMMTLNTGVLTLKMSSLNESTQWVHSMSPHNESTQLREEDNTLIYLQVRPKFSVTLHSVHTDRNWRLKIKLILT